MSRKSLRPVAGLILLVGLMGLAPAAVASEAAKLTAMLEEFLATSHQRPAHERFWAEDLVYTSSSGLRFGKAEILGGFEGSDASADEQPAITYSGEDVDVRVYGTTAVVAFRLVGTPRDPGSDTAYYFNTGTFLKRGGVWKAVAWQATKIPPGPAD